MLKISNKLKINIFYNIYIYIYLIKHELKKWFVKNVRKVEECSFEMERVQIRD